MRESFGSQLLKSKPVCSSLWSPARRTLDAHLAHRQTAFHDASANLPRILAAIEEAANNGARLVVFSGVLHFVWAVSMNSVLT